MEASVSGKKEIKNIYQLKLMQELAFVQDEETYSDIKELIVAYLYQKLQQQIAEVELEKGYNADTYTKRVEAQNQA